MTMSTGSPDGRRMVSLSLTHSPPVSLEAASGRQPSCALGHTRTTAATRSPSRILSPSVVKIGVSRQRSRTRCRRGSAPEPFVEWQSVISSPPSTGRTSMWVFESDLLSSASAIARRSGMLCRVRVATEEDRRQDRDALAGVEAQAEAGAGWGAGSGWGAGAGWARARVGLGRGVGRVAVGLRRGRLAAGRRESAGGTGDATSAGGAGDAGFAPSAIRYPPSTGFPASATTGGAAGVASDSPIDGTLVRLVRPRDPEDARTDPVARTILRLGRRVRWRVRARAGPSARGSASAFTSLRATRMRFWSYGFSPLRTSTSQTAGRLVVQPSSALLRVEGRRDEDEDRTQHRHDSRMR